MTNPEWANRVLGREQVDPLSLKPHGGNPRLHPVAQMKALERIFSDLGQIAPLIVNKRTRTVLNGHARLRLSLEQDQKSVDVCWVDVDEDDEDAVIASFDAVGQMYSVKEQQAARLFNDARVQQHSDWLNTALSSKLPEWTPQRDVEESLQRSEKKERKTRNRAWYVYALHDDVEDVEDWLRDRFEDIDGISVKAQS